MSNKLPFKNIQDSQLSCEKHLKTTSSKVNKTIGIIWKLRNSLPTPSLFKSFTRPHLDFEDIIYDQSFNNSFENKIESIQFAITEERLKKYFTRNQALNLFNIVIGIGNFVIFTKLQLTNFQTIYSKLFPLLTQIITLGILISF